MHFANRIEKKRNLRVEVELLINIKHMVCCRRHLYRCHSLIVWMIPMRILCEKLRRILIPLSPWGHGFPFRNFLFFVIIIRLITVIFISNREVLDSMQCLRCDLFILNIIFESCTRHQFNQWWIAVCERGLSFE